MNLLVWLAMYEFYYGERGKSIRDYNHNLDVIGFEKRAGFWRRRIAYIFEGRNLVSGYIRLLDASGFIKGGWVNT